MTKLTFEKDIKETLWEVSIALHRCDYDSDGDLVDSKTVTSDTIFENPSLYESSMFYKSLLRDEK